MVKKLLFTILVALALVVGTIYISIRALDFKPGFPENTVLSGPTASNQWQGMDSVRLKATNSYMAGAYRQAILGKNYRKVWDAPIKVPIIWLDTFGGGLRPLKSGGGGQTRSLKLVDTEGHYFTVRSVCKDACARIPDIGTQLRIENLVLDGISAGHPYATLPVAKLSEAAGLLHSHPKLVFLPEQPALDTFNEFFGNRLFTLEYEPEGNNVDWTGIPNATSLMDSEMVTERLLESPLHRTDQVTMVKARLFDLLIGDWDRHQGNWGWVECQDKAGVVYIPFPVDRDMAFYGIGGVVPWLLNRPGELENFRPFGERIDYLPGMLYNARFFDPFFLNEMTREDFLRTAAELQQSLTDKLIQEAFLVWPDTIFKLNGPEIIQHIITRRNDLPTYAARTYELLARQPQVMGTNQRDSFIIRQEGEKQVVDIYASTHTGAFLKKYHRSFHAEETAEILLYGFGGDDLLEVRGELSIPVSFFGGKGQDRFITNPAVPIVQSKLTLVDDAGGMTMPKGYMLEDKYIKPKMPMD